MSKAEARKHFLVQTFDVRGKRIFGAFTSSVDFYLHYRLLDRKEHHEVIMGEKPQKPRFDIDLKIEKVPSGWEMNELGNKVRDAVIVACAHVLVGYGVLDHVNHILDTLSLYTSSSSTKYSLHIILHKYQHYNNREAREFFRLVVNQSVIDGVYNLGEAVRMAILDPGIYKSSQNFRMLGSGKRVEPPTPTPMIIRPKMYLNHINIGGITHRFPVPNENDPVDVMRLFRKSAITDVVGCTHIPIVLPVKPPIELRLDLPDGYQDTVTECVAQVEGGAFSIKRVHGSLFELKRDRPSKCCLCRRIHEAISPYVTISRYGEIVFHCRRAEDAHHSDTSIVTKLVIGSLNGVTVKEEVLGDCDDNDSDDEEEEEDDEETEKEEKAVEEHPKEGPVTFDHKAYRKPYVKYEKKSYHLSTPSSNVEYMRGKQSDFEYTRGQFTFKS